MSGCAGWGLAPLASSDEGIGVWSPDGGGRMEYVVPAAPPMYDVKCSDVQEVGSSSPWPATTPGYQPFALEGHNPLPQAEVGGQDALSSV